MDRHKIWRTVEHNLRGLEQAAPEGWRAVVDVFLAGREKPVRLGRVETSKDPAFPWVFLAPELILRHADEVKEGEAAPDDRGIFVQEQFIARVEVHFTKVERTDEGVSKRIGFSYEAVDEPGKTVGD
jgi:hypothetical protein